MKKRIVALIGALSLTFAMSLNVFAAGSVDAGDVKGEIENISSEVKVEVVDKDGAVEVNVEGVTIEVPTTGLVETAVAANAAQKEAIAKAEPTVVSKDEVKEVTITTVAKADVAKTVVKVAEAVANPAKADDKIASVSNVEVLIPPVEIKPTESTEGAVTFLVPKSVLKITELAADEQVWGIDGATGDVAVGKLDVDGNVYFTAKSFSPWTFVKVKVVEKQTTTASVSQPAYNPDWDPAVQAERQAAAQAEHEAVWAAWLAANGGTIPVVALAPKTGDVVAMVSILAVIFLGGAATAVAMSKKRA